MRLPIFFFFALLLAAPVWAAEFTVNSTVDAADANPGDGVCADAAFECTPRAAVMETNALPGADVVHLPAGTYRRGIQEHPGYYTAFLDIDDELSVVGEGPASTIVQGARLGTVVVVGSRTPQVRVVHEGGM